MSQSVSPLLSDVTYNRMKFVTTVVLPAAGALYFALAQIWGFGHAEAVVGTIAAVNTFFGVLLGISSKQYNALPTTIAGELNIQKDDDGQYFQLTGSTEQLAALDGLDRATFKVVRPKS